MTWRDMAQDNFEAASLLYLEHRWRACCNRAYYAAFARYTGVLIGRGLTPRDKWETWVHLGLPELVLSHLRDFGDASAINASYILSRLYDLRCIADYQPLFGFGRREAFEASSLMGQVFRFAGKLERNHGQA